MNRKLVPDLPQVRAQFEAWRRTRQSKERMPVALKSAVATLLDQYPLRVVRRELNLSSQQLAKLKQQFEPLPQPPAFVALTAQELNLRHRQPVEAESPAEGSECLAVIERRDGCKLSLRVPASCLEKVISSFVGA
ncbi:MAG: hypothetical protein K1Y36_28365 [Blastocatellia bacterium]|nr:hypothetical protein [Blastocatellia bacterium]